MKDVKLKKLQEIRERDLITTEEYEKKKMEIEDMPKEKIEETKEDAKEVKLKSDKTLIIGAIIIMLLFVGATFGLRYLGQERPETIDEMHELNFEGKLKKDQGYLYDGVYSFVKFDGLWYAQLVSPQGTRLYNIQFRYGPREVENIKIEGTLNTEILNNATENSFIVLDEIGRGTSTFDGMSIAAAVAEYIYTKIKAKTLFPE